MTCPGLGARAELSRTSGCRRGRRWCGRDPDHSPCWRRPPATRTRPCRSAGTQCRCRPVASSGPSRPRSQRRAVNPFCTPSGVGQRIVILREVGRLKPNGFGRNADPCGRKG